MERFMDALIADNAYQYFDIMSFHPYASDPSGVLSRFTALQGKMALQAGMAAKPIWITEVGFNTAGWNPGAVPDEQTKATYLTQSLQLLTQNGAAYPVFVYDLHEEDSSTAGYGLEQKDPTTLQTTYLPAFSAYKSLVLQ
jgi:exo-beta-1,3-glucanase (GH17 family)